MYLRSCTFTNGYMAITHLSLVAHVSGDCWFILVGNLSVISPRETNIGSESKS